MSYLRNDNDSNISPHFIDTLVNCPYKDSISWASRVRKYSFPRIKSSSEDLPGKVWLHSKKGIHRKSIG